MLTRQTPDLYIVIGAPHHLKGANLTVEEADAACVVLHGPVSWDEAQEYHRDYQDARGGRVIFSECQGPYAWVAVRGVADPRWRKVVDDQVTIGVTRNVNGCDLIGADERARKKCAKAFNDLVGARYIGGGWWDYSDTVAETFGVVQGYWFLLRILERLGYVKRVTDPVTNGRAWAFYPGLVRTA